MVSSGSLRAALYVRVSSEEQVEGYSLDAQERAGRLFCEAHGWDIVQVYRDEGKSARTDDLAKRPEFQRLLADAEAGRIDVVIVHKLDRFARNLRVTLETLERLEHVGVGFVSISEQMDFTTPIGKVVLATLAAFAQYFSDNLSTETKKGKRERKAQGLYNGLLPFGVTKSLHGVPILDQTPSHCIIAAKAVIVPAQGLDLLFRLAAAGKTDRDIAKALNEAGYLTTGNRGSNPFSKDTVREIVQNRFYVGELPDGQGGWVPGRHEALVDPDLFAQAQRARAINTRRPAKAPAKTTPWALSGVAVCGACGKPMRSHGSPGGKRRIVCSSRADRHDCDEPTFLASAVEAQIGQLLERFQVPDDTRTDLIATWVAAQPPTVDVQGERRKLERRRQAVMDLYEEGDLDLSAYREKKAEIAAMLAALPEAQESNEAVGERLLDYLSDLSQAWRVATSTERNQIARQIFVEAIITNGTAVAITPRPEFRAFFEPFRCQPDDGDCGVGGSDGDRGRVLELFRPRLLVVPDLRLHRRHCGVARRYAVRARKLTPVEEQSIRALAATKSLRSLAADFGVSHETVRAILQSAARRR